MIHFDLEGKRITIHCCKDQYHYAVKYCNLGKWNIEKVVLEGNHYKLYVHRVNEVAVRKVLKQHTYHDLF